ncbi:MAG: SH3 domain-containing protein [Candidatus Peribacteraceae bacterium]|nr:SH3 domain-containing protein [Candidatus Peribacteraceae bacterium]
MNRYRSARRAGSATAAAPIVAFLLIASFGLLFVTGCSSTTGTEDVTEDDTFTAEDIARFQELARDDGNYGSATSADSSAGMSASVLQEEQEPLPVALTGSATTLVSVDPALRKAYDAMRLASSGKGGNVYRVTNAFLNVRGEPAVNAPFVARLDQGDIVTVVEFTNGSWAKIAIPGGAQGYVAVRYIAKVTTEEKLKDEQKAFEGQYFVNFAFLNVRSSPATGGDKIGEIPGQAIVKPILIEKGWAKVPFEGKEGYVSMEFLSAFRPNFLVRQDTYTLPILHYAADQEGAIAGLSQHLARLKQDGVRFLTLRDLFDTVQTQETRDARIAPKSVIITVTGITAQNVKAVSDALGTTPATLFLETAQVGISGISEKQVLTLQANGFDIQSAGHTGDNLQTLTNAQTRLELEQSRLILEDITHKTVFAIAYPQGGANDRVLNQAADAGYLFGMGSAPEKIFSREQFLRLPSYAVTSGMTPEDVLNLTK